MLKINNAEVRYPIGVCFGWWNNIVLLLLFTKNDFSISYGHFRHKYSVQCDFTNRWCLQRCWLNGEHITIWSRKYAWACWMPCLLWKRWGWLFQSSSSIILSLLTSWLIFNQLMLSLGDWAQFIQNPMHWTGLRGSCQQDYLVNSMSFKNTFAGLIHLWTRCAFCSDFFWKVFV